MPIYKNNQEITKVYRGGTEISKVYSGDKLIFDNTPPPPAKLSRILLYDFGGKDYYPTTDMAHGEWDVRPNGYSKSYTSMIFKTNLVPAFRLPFNAMKSQLCIEMSISRCRGLDMYGSVNIWFDLTNDPTVDPSDGTTWKEVVSSDAQSKFQNNNGFKTFAIKDSNFVQDNILPTYPNMKYWCYVYGLGNGSFSDATKDCYLMAFMYMMSKSDMNNNTQGYVKLGKVYLDITTDPGYQAYLNS